MAVSEEFAGLGLEVTHCQTEEHRRDCLSRKHDRQVLDNCRCSPYNMKSYYGHKVMINYNKVAVKLSGGGWVQE